ncbi:MAG: hypothetical protein NTU88_16610 [Armatimonadetes bacterium]|nr:hypothetical protein [Armatimonadota bacterium]
MKHKCTEIEEAIWEHARTGADLPAEVGRHTSECSACRELLTEARRLLSLMDEAIPVPDAPACRAEVLARIEGLRVRRPVWAYACACVLLLIILIGGSVLLRPSRPVPQFARKDVERVILPTPKLERPAPPAVATEPEPRPTQSIAPDRRRIERRRHAWRPQKRILVRAPRPRPQVEQPAPNELEAPQPAMENRPVMAVAVTWGAEPSQSSSYAYTERNEATGETTICRVVKSPGAVSIFMESKPGGQEPSSKGA